MTENQVTLVHVSFNSGKPVYLQIVDQIKAAAASGAILPGESLPSIRPLSEQLRINRNTIAKAYAELERQGIIHSLPGKGCFLSNGANPFRKAVRDEMMLTEIDSAVVQAHNLQVSEKEFMAMVAKRWEHFADRRAEQSIELAQGESASGAKPPPKS